MHFGNGRLLRRADLCSDVQTSNVCVETGDGVWRTGRDRLSFAEDNQPTQSLRQSINQSISRHFCPRGQLASGTKEVCEI